MNGLTTWLMKLGGRRETKPNRAGMWWAIDLGTTNSAVTFVDTAAEARPVRTFSVPQLVAPGQVESRETLPSFHYEAAPDEFPGCLSICPGKAGCTTAVGVFAREQGRLGAGAGDRFRQELAVPHRRRSHRRAVALARGGGRGTARRPVEVSSPVSARISGRRGISDSPEHPLAEQDIVLTLPASFDEVARELTVQAARQAGLPRVVLIEEPQAAFYAWIDAHKGTLGTARRRPARKSWSATSAAARPTSR